MKERVNEIKNVKNRKSILMQYLIQTFPAWNAASATLDFSMCRSKKEKERKRKGGKRDRT